MSTHLNLKSIVLGGAFLFFAVLLPILFHPSEALAIDAVVTGTVVDPSGAAVPAATVKVHNTKTGVDRNLATNDAGVFRVSEAPGEYDVTIQKAGFKVAEYTAITLTVDQILTLNTTLEVGAVTQTVEVSGQSVAAVDLESGQISTVIEQRAVLDMPLITRDPYSLTLLSPGVIVSNTRFGGFSANGTREKDNNFMLDGTDNNDTDVPGGGDGLSSANPDSIQEFRVITNNFSAEYGRNDGAIIDVISKSGTNTIHGDAYWFGRYDATGARDFFNETPGTPKNPYERNIFGGSAGGPIRKDKTFWFGNYEGNRFLTTLTQASNVPTAQFRTGVFNTIDPVTTNSVPIDVSTANSINNGFQTPLDPTIQSVLALYPTPNGPMVDNTEGLRYFPSPDRLAFDIFTVKIDHRVNDRNSLMGRYTYQHVNDPIEGLTSFLPPNLGGVGTNQRTQSLSVDWTATLRSNLVNDLRFGANRTTDPFICTGTNVLDQFVPLDPLGHGTDLQLQDGFGFGPANFGCQQLFEANSENRHTGTYQLIDNLSWVSGKHSLKFGFEGRDIYSNSYDDFSARPLLNFDPFYRYSIPSLQNVPAGVLNDPIINDEVSMLLGVVVNQAQQQFFSASGTRTADDISGFRQKEIGLFVQDAWKVKSNLTINAGLRWEYFGVPYEAHNNFSNLFTDPSGPAPFTFTIVGPGHRSAWQNEYLNFEPRLGFAWDPFKNGKTSVRGAYGIFHTRTYGNLFENSRSNPPFQVAYDAVPFATLTGLPVPATQPTSATVTNYDPTTGTGGLDYPGVFDPVIHSPYSQNWNFGIQRQITDSLLVEVNYIGVRGLRLLRVVDGNPPQPGLVSALEAYCKVTDPSINTVGCVDTADQSSIQGFNLYIGQEQGALPFDSTNNSAFAGAALTKSIAKSFYNGLQVNVTKQLSRGVYIHSAYTWSHTLDNASDPLDAAAGNRNLPRNSFNLRPEYGNSDFDVRHRLSIDFVYQPNLGRGRGYLNHGISGRIMEGWELTGIATFQTGQPYEIFGFRDSQHTSLSDRAMIIGPRGIPVSSDKTQTGPALSSFTNAPFDSASNLSRNQFFGPGVDNWNVGLLKDQSITERVKIQIRFEFFNLFNRVQFQQPDNLIGDTGTFGHSTLEYVQPDGTTGARQIQFALKLMF